MARRWCSIINAQLPFKTLGELLADAKANPNKYSVGTSGPASSPGLTLAQLNKAAQVQIQAVPYRGSGDAAQPLPAARSRARSRSTRRRSRSPMTARCARVAVASPKRLEGWPDVPTFTEQGYKIDQRGFVGLAAPAKTPKPIVDFLSKHLNEVVQSAEFKKRMAVLGMAPPPAADNTPEKFDKFMREEIARQGELAEMSGQKIAAAEVMFSSFRGCQRREPGIHNPQLSKSSAQGACDSGSPLRGVRNDSHSISR